MVAEKSQRLYSFDILRIIAICAVVLLHVSAEFVTAFDSGTVEFVWGNAFNSLSRFAVPVFFMISGALMLDENKHVPVKKVLRSAKNMLVLTFSWSFIYTLGYNVIRPLVVHEPIYVEDVLHTLFYGHYHMWYLYVLVGLYLATPLLRSFVEKNKPEMLRNYLFFSIAIRFIVPFINFFINMFTWRKDMLIDFLSHFRFDYIYEYVIYYILGWYIVNVGMSKRLRAVIYTGGILGLIATFVGTQFFFEVERPNYFYENNSLNVLLYSTAVFTFTHSLFENNGITLGPFAVKMSNLSFGVYIIHCMYLFGFRRICNGIGSAPLAIFAAFAGSVVMSFVTVFFMSKIPLVKKLVRG